jgi:hypothetical protein
MVLALIYRFSHYIYLIVCHSSLYTADIGGRLVYSFGPRSLICWDGEFESLRRRGCLSLVSVVCCQVEVSAKDRLLVQRNTTLFGVSECDREASTMRRPKPTTALEP